MKCLPKAALVTAWLIVGGLNLTSSGQAAAAISPPAQSPAASVPSGAPDLLEVLDLLKANLAGATASELNRAAVLGLIEQLAPRVTLGDGLGGAAGAGAETKGDGAGAGKGTGPHPARGPAISATVFERNFGYVRLSTLGSDVPAKLASAVSDLGATNKLRGLVLDLRFCAGGDYASAVTAADQFFAEEQELVDWGEGMRRSTAKSNAVSLPMAVLVNRRTSGPAEVLAGILRQGEVALLVGTNTAGQAGITREFTLKTGQRLRVAVAPVKVLGGRELPFSGLAADVSVGVDPEEERLFINDSFRAVRSTTSAGAVEVANASTNARPRRRMNEAELVRLSREGQDPRDAREPAVAAPALKGAEPIVPQVTDPVLARALDILKGLAVVQRLRG